MEHLLLAADVATAIRDTLAGIRTRAQLSTWAHRAILAADAGTTPYDPRHQLEIHAAVYQLRFMSEAAEYALGDAELHAMLRRLEAVWHADDNARLQTALRLLPSRVSDIIQRNTDRNALRRFAVACAYDALAACAIEEPLLLRALYLVGNGDAVNPGTFTHLRQEVGVVVEQLDDLAFQAQEASDGGDGSHDEYTSAVRAARAATSVLRALESPAELAAAEACYEAFHALDISRGESILLEIARRELHQ